MKNLILLLLIGSVIGIAVFGFTIFDHNAHTPNSDCVASVINGVVCPTNIVNMALHHISVAQTFLQTLAPSTDSILLLSLLFAVLSFLLLRKDLFHPQLVFSSRGYKNPTRSRRRQKITSWLALFEHSPAL